MGYVAGDGTVHFRPCSPEHYDLVAETLNLELAHVNVVIEDERT